MGALLEMFKGEAGGKPSIMRILTFGVVITVMVVWVVHNAIAISKGLGFISMGWEEVSLISGALCFKAVQTFGESGGSSSTPETTDALPVDKKE